MTVQRTPYRLSIRRGTGCLFSLFGLPFAVAGLFVMGAALAADLGETGPWPFVLVFGLVFALVGFSFILGRKGLIVDKREGSVRKWSGLLVPFFERRIPLASVERVEIAREQRRTKNGSYTVYPVRLTTKDKPLDIYETRSYELARQESENVASFIHCAVLDRSQGSEVLREAGTLNESLRERARRLGSEPQLPSGPTPRRLRKSVRGSTTEIRLPGQKGLGFSRPMLITGLVAALCVPVLFLTGFLGGVGFALFLAVGTITGAIATRDSGPETIRIDHEKLTLERSGLLKPREITIPLTALEELRQRHDGLLACSDIAVLLLGQGLRRDELTWLYETVLALASHDPLKPHDQEDVAG